MRLGLEIRIGSRVHVLGRRRGAQHDTRILHVPRQQLESLLYDDIGRVELLGPDIRVHRILDLLIAALVQRPEIKPDFGNIRVEPDCARIRIECVFKLVDLEVEHADRDPKRRVPPIAVHGLLIGFVRFIVLLRRHVRAAEQVPALCVRRIGLQATGKITDGGFLIDEWCGRLVVEPSELL